MLKETELKISDFLNTVKGKRVFHISDTSTEKYALLKELLELIKQGPRDIIIQVIKDYLSLLE